MRKTIELLNNGEGIDRNSVKQEFEKIAEQGAVMVKDMLGSPDARYDLRALLRFVLQNDRYFAERIRDLIFEKVALLASMPDRGRPGRVSGKREFLVEATPYIIPYRVRENTLEVLRIYHSKRTWPDEL